MRKLSCRDSGAVILVFFLCGLTAFAQGNQEPSKIEVGGQFTSLTYVPVQESIGPYEPGHFPTSTDVGFGGRFTLNLNSHLAIEAEGNFFPHRFSVFPLGGRVLQGQFGGKFGKRFKRFGVFGKARPGLVSFSEALTQTGTIRSRPTRFAEKEDKRTIHEPTRNMH
jgi:hypothetical protein